MRLRIASRAAVRNVSPSTSSIPDQHDGVDVEGADEVGEGGAEVAAGAGDDGSVDATGGASLRRAAS